MAERFLSYAKVNLYLAVLGEYADGIRCVAAPITNDLGYPIAAIGISGPKFRLSMDKVRRFGGVVREAALEISHRAGYDPAGRPTGRASSG